MSSQHTWEQHKNPELIEGTHWPTDAKIELVIQYESTKEVRSFANTDFFPVLYHMSRRDYERMAASFTRITELSDCLQQWFANKSKEAMNHMTVETGWTLDAQKEQERITDIKDAKKEILMTLSKLDVPEQKAKELLVWMQSLRTKSRPKSGKYRFDVNQDHYPSFASQTLTQPDPRRQDTSLYPNVMIKQYGKTPSVTDENGNPKVPKACHLSRNYDTYTPEETNKNITEKEENCFQTNLMKEMPYYNNENVYCKGSKRGRGGKRGRGMKRKRGQMAIRGERSGNIQETISTKFKNHEGMNEVKNNTKPLNVNDFNQEQNKPKLMQYLLQDTQSLVSNKVCLSKKEKNETTTGDENGNKISSYDPTHTIAHDEIVINEED